MTWFVRTTFSKTIHFRKDNSPSLQLVHQSTGLSWAFYGRTSLWSGSLEAHLQWFGLPHSAGHGVQAGLDIEDRERVQTRGGPQVKSTHHALLWKEMFSIGTVRRHASPCVRPIGKRIFGSQPTWWSGPFTAVPWARWNPLIARRCPKPEPTTRRHVA